MCRGGRGARWRADGPGFASLAGHTPKWFMGGPTREQLQREEGGADRMSTSSSDMCRSVQEGEIREGSNQKCCFISL